MEINLEQSATENRWTKALFKLRHLPISVIALSIVYFAHSTGLLYTQYNFTDYYQILETQTDLENLGFTETIIKWFNYELFTINRLRLFYRVSIITQTALFGTEYTLWNVARLFNVLAVLFLWYKIILKMGIGNWLASVLSLMSVLGFQSYTFYRFGPNITYALIPFSVSMYALLSYYYDNSKKFPYLTVTTGLLLSCLSKETMILIIPSFIFLHAYHTTKKENIKSQFHVICYFVLITSCLLLIVKLLGATGTGYAGVDAQTHPFNYVKYFLFLLKTKYTMPTIVIIILFALLLVYKPERKKSIWLLLFFLSYTLSQIFIYHKSGLKTGRYHYPMALAFPLTIGLQLSALKNYLPDLMIQLLTTTLIGISLISINIKSEVTKSAKNKASYAIQFAKIQSEIQNQLTSKENKILVVGDPAINYEWMSKGLYTWLKSKGYDNKIDYYLTASKVYDGNPFFLKLSNDFKRKFSDNLISNPIHIDKYTMSVVMSNRSWNLKDSIRNDNQEEFINLIDTNENTAMYSYRIGDFMILKHIQCEQPIFPTNINKHKHNYKLRINRINSIHVRDMHTDGSGHIKIDRNSSTILIEGVASTEVDSLKFCTNKKLHDVSISKFNNKLNTFELRLQEESRLNLPAELIPLLYANDTIYTYSDKLIKLSYN